MPSYRTRGLQMFEAACSRSPDKQQAAAHATTEAKVTTPSHPGQPTRGMRQQQAALALASVGSDSPRAGRRS